MHGKRRALIEAPRSVGPRHKAWDSAAAESFIYLISMPESLKFLRQRLTSPAFQVLAASSESE